MFSSRKFSTQLLCLNGHQTVTGWRVIVIYLPSLCDRVNLVNNSDRLWKYDCSSEHRKAIKSTFETDLQWQIQLKLNILRDRRLTTKCVTNNWPLFVCDWSAGRQILTKNISDKSDVSVTEQDMKTHCNWLIWTQVTSEGHHSKNHPLQWFLAMNSSSYWLSSTLLVIVTTL